MSKELCGGTHTSRTGNIGLFCISSVESIGKGIKRISALTGENAIEYVQNQRNILKNTSSLLKVNSENLVEKINNILTHNANKNKTSKNIDIKDLKLIKDNKIKIGYITKDDFDKKFNESMIEISDKIKGIVLGIFGVDKKRLLICVSADLKNSLSASEIMEKLTEKVGGKGGGNNRVASGGVSAETDEIIKAFTCVCEKI